MTGSAALTAVVAPVFLVGALSTRISEDLGAAATGAVVTAFFVGSGLLAVPMGRVAERVGAANALRLGVILSGVADLVVATSAEQWWQLGAVLFVAGTAVGLVDTGAARAFVDAVPERRHGLAFGAKEASVPAASMLAGLSVPLLAQQVGWRAGFVAAALLAGAVLAIVPRSLGGASSGGPPAPGRPPRGPLLLFAAGAALGTAAATAAATLLVPAFDDRGWSEGSAGVLLAVASVLSISTRLAVGSTSDRRPELSWTAVSTLMAAGAVGAAVLSVSTGAAGAVAVVAAMSVVGFGWGWTGLAFQTATRVSPGAPAVAAGIVLAGLSIGGATGPIAFGAIASAASYGTAWAAAGAAFAAGSAATLVARSWHSSPVALRDRP